MLPGEIKARSPLEELSLDRFKGRTYLQESTLNALSAATLLCPNNPNRVFWLLSNRGTGDVIISSIPTNDGNNAITLAAAGGIVSMAYDEDGEAVGYPVYAFAYVSPTPVHILEVIRE